MSKLKFRISATDLSKLHRALKGVDDKTKKIAGLNASKFLLAATELDADDADELEIAVKSAILHASGDFDSLPEELDDEEDLEEDLLMGEGDLAVLIIKLNKILKKIKAKKRVTMKDMEGCSTVSDVVEMVSKKI